MFLADMLMIMIVSGIFISRLKIIDTRSEVIALTILLSVSIKTLFIFFLIWMKIQPAIGHQLIFTTAAFLAYLLFLSLQSKLFLNINIKFKQELFFYTKTFAILASLFSFAIFFAIYFPITGADGVWYHVKGMIYFNEARFDSERIISQLRQYPPMIGLLYAWLLSGDIERLPVIFPVLYFCLIIIVFHRIWNHSNNSKVATFCALTLGTTPYLWWHSFLPFLDLTATIFFTLGILYWFCLIKNIATSTNSFNDNQNHSIALLSGLLFGFASWTRPEFILFSALPLFLLVFMFDRNEKPLKEREGIILRFGCATLFIPSLWFIVLLNFNDPLDSTIKQLIFACSGLWLLLGLTLLGILRLSYKVSKVIVITFFVICLLGLFYVLPQSILFWNIIIIRVFRLFSVHIFFAGTFLLIFFIFTKKLKQLSLEEKVLGVFILLFLLTQFFLYAYSGLKWPTLLNYIHNTFNHPGNSINLSDTRGTLAIYPAFVFFVFSLLNINFTIESKHVRRYLFAIITINLSIILIVFTIPRVKFISDNHVKSYQQLTETLGPFDLPNQFRTAYQIAHQIQIHVKKGQVLFLPSSIEEKSVVSVMRQVLFGQKLFFSGDTNFIAELKSSNSPAYALSPQNPKEGLCYGKNVKLLGNTGFVLCQIK